MMDEYRLVCDSMFKNILQEGSRSLKLVFPTNDKGAVIKKGQVLQWPTCSTIP